MPMCYVSAGEYLVDARFRFLCYCLGNDAGGDDLVKDLAALFLAEQLYGVLEKLGGKLLDNGGGIGIVEQLLDGKIPEIHDNTPFRYCGGVAPANTYIIPFIPQNGKSLTVGYSFKRTVGHIKHNVGHREGSAGVDVAELDICSAAAIGLFRDKDSARDEL